MKRKYPLPLLLSAAVYGLTQSVLVGIAGVGILVIGIFLSFQILLMIAGTFSLLFYLYVGIVWPLQALRRSAREVSDAKLAEIIEDARRRGNRALYKRVMIALDDAAQPADTAQEKE